VANTTARPHVDGWGLHFQEKVWTTPIDAVNWTTIVGAIVIAVLGVVLANDKWKITNFVPGALAFSVGQAIVAWMKEWAERPLFVKPKEKQN